MFWKSPEEWGGKPSAAEGAASRLGLAAPGKGHEDFISVGGRRARCRAAEGLSAKSTRVHAAPRAATPPFQFFLGEHVSLKKEFTGNDPRKGIHSLGLREKPLKRLAQ